MRNLFLAVIIIAWTGGSAQIMTKRIKTYTFESGFTISEGMTIELVKGKNDQEPGGYIWTFQGGVLIVPNGQCNQRFDGMTFTITKVVSMKAGEKEKSIIAEFEFEDRKYYSFVSQSIVAGEAKYY